MFIGHYAASLALKRVEKKASLGMLFIAVQLVDIIFFPLTLLGIERYNIIENFTQATHFELEYMPYTHSLVASFIWAGLMYGFYLIWNSKNRKIALIMGLAVLSHWFLDLIVHTPDLPLWTDTSTKLGFGLWNNALASYSLEAILILAGLWVYLRATTATSKSGQYGMCIFVILLLAINAINTFGPLLDDNKTVFSMMSIMLYLLFAGIAHWLDKKRI